MDDQARSIELTMKPVTEQDVKRLGATSDAKGVWTFPDGSRGRFTKKPIAVYDESDEKRKLCGFAYFEKIEWVQ